MASYIKKKFFKEPKPKTQKQEACTYSLADYDATFWLPNKILSAYFLKLDLQEVQPTTIFGTVIFWFMMSHVIMATVLESISMIMTGSGGTLIELFTMMPCVGYLLVDCHIPTQEYKILNALIAMSKTYKIKRFKPIYQNLVTELRNMWPVGKVTEEEHNIIVDSLKSLRHVMKAYCTCNLGLGAIYFLPPYISLIKEMAGFKQEQRLLPFFYWFPFDPLQDNIYEAVMVLQTFHCFCTIGFMVSGDVLFVLFLSHITTQFSLLKVTINKMICVTIDNQLVDAYPLGVYSKEHHLNSNGQGTTNGEMDENLEEKLVKIINRHRDLIRLAEDVENMYSFSLLVNVINSSIIICFCLFCVTFVEKWNEFVYKVFLTVGILQIWILCWYGQKLLDTSSGIGDALYNSGWYTTTNKIKKSILIMIHRSQRPVYVTTFGFSILSLESYATILKTSWSYFTLMINMYKG